MSARSEGTMRSVSLDDKYELERGRIFLSGTQAIVRLALDQRRRDARGGLRTAGFVSGYRGSPLGGVDTALWQAARQLADHDIHFEPGLNEELAATAVAGSQQTAIVGRSRFDGVFGLWYAKNPGVDRAADVLKHANAAGTAPHGGVLALSGDDPGAGSSTLPNQCDQAFAAAFIPVLSPASLAEILEFGLLGIALSRYSGLWVGVKTVADTVECTGSIAVAPDRPRIVTPSDFQIPPGGLGVRWPDERWDQDRRLLNFKLPAAKAFAYANGLDRIAFGGGDRYRLAIVTAGKAYGDVRQALEDLEIDGQAASALGVLVYKVGLVWPLEPERIGTTVEGIEEVLVVEERRAVVEPQLKELAYNWPADRRPRIVGKRDESGAVLLPEGGELSPSLVALVIGRRLARLGCPDHVLKRLRTLEEAQCAPQLERSAIVRMPHFCAGCPHARSTRLPEGSIAFAGIGCHSLRLWMSDSQTVLMPQMGGEGAAWLGLAPFVEAKHVFQNMGDGTYVHSGILGIRAAVAAKRSITFRILYNEATAMTGGQPVEGGPGVPEIARQLAAEGVKRIAVISDEPDKYPLGTDFGPSVTIHHRDELDALQQQLREWPGVSAIIYDQVCATEKRRRHKRGTEAYGSVRPFINARVCEGCGDCVEQSQCAAVVPLETPLGRKRKIDQSACNSDLSCLEGFCPSFVTIEGGKLRQAARDLAGFELPPPRARPLDGIYDILVDGIGGSGVMTIGATLGMAAHLVGNGCSILDNTGIARKGGAVSSHVRLAPQPDDIHMARIADRKAALVLACDMVASTASASLIKIDRGHTCVIANANAVPTLNQRLEVNGHIDAQPLREALFEAAGAAHCDFLAATEIAERLLGDGIYANMIMFGFAYQKGLIPLPFGAIDAAIALNGTAVEANRRAFAWGRRAAHDPSVVEERLRPFREAEADADLGALIARRVAYLTGYQDAAYAERYTHLLGRVREAEQKMGMSDGALALAVAKAYFRLLAIKDEYEVARLYSDGEFVRALGRQFDGDYQIRYHLAPPLLSRPDPVTGRIKKRAYGPWIGTLFGVLACMKGLRGTWLDPFGHTAERKMERRLIAEYESTVEALLKGLDHTNYDLAAEIAALPEQMRGYGHVKARNVALAKAREAALLAGFQGKTALTA